MKMSTLLKEKESEYLRLYDEHQNAFREFCRMARQEGWTDDEVTVRIIRNSCRETPEIADKMIKQYLAQQQKLKARLTPAERKRLYGDG